MSSGEERWAGRPGWTAIALGRDIAPEATRAVIVDGRELALWRGASGEIHAWEDRCPHRGMRLSFGFVRGESLNCLYHGWRFAAGAECTAIPAHPDLEVPPTIRARAFEVREGGGLIWARLAGGDGEPPALASGLVPLASVAVKAGAEDVLSRFGTACGLIRMEDAGEVFLAMHSVNDGKCMLHALARPDALEAAWTWLRATRAELEGAGR